MDGNDISSDHVIAELIDMGFEFSKIMKAIEAVGPRLEDAIEFILKGDGESIEAQNVSRPPNFSADNCFTCQRHDSEKKVSPLHSHPHLKQSRITFHLQSMDRAKASTSSSVSEASISGTESCRSGHLEEQRVLSDLSASRSSEHNLHPQIYPANFEGPVQGNGNSHFQHVSLSGLGNEEVGLDWEQKIGAILLKHFGFSSLKGFQKEAVQTWLAHRDCLVLAATGSGKSLCFQIPALLTGKVVVVISPLISLMRDQCLNLAKHGVSACFLGSGQPDSSVEHKAMHGTYDIIYVCPETTLRLVEPLQRLAENRGIALFAIDEVHCVSKWGHDFRPDYRRLSALREKFKPCNLKTLKYDIPLMALTATATITVRQDIIKSLHMTEDTKIVLTSFFRPNLRFSVKHSRTSSVSSYEKDFHELIVTYATSRTSCKKWDHITTNDPEDDSHSPWRCLDRITSDGDEFLPCDYENIENDFNDASDLEVNLENENAPGSSCEDQMTVEYLEDELDIHQNVDDLDVSCGEFCGGSLVENWDIHEPSEMLDQPTALRERLGELQGPLGQGPTIIYVPTRKETLKIAEYLCRFGVRAAAYHAKLSKAHLSHVHEEFHRNILQVVVATIAFGMGIDKSNVRRIIHYGWPQSLEAYYQEAGRAGRDGRLSDCTLYANLSRVPTLLPSNRSEEQTRQAYKMLTDCFRYGMSTASCRAKTLVKYFGEDFSYEKCHLCDVCVNGPPKLQNLKEEANAFLQVLVAQCGTSRDGSLSSNGGVYKEYRRDLIEKPNFRAVISGVREKFEKFSASDRLWWQGLARILEDKGYIKEGDNIARVCIKYPQPTDMGMKFLLSGVDQTLDAYPEADMLLPTLKQKSYSTFSEWGRGWADPEIRQQRLGRIRNRTRKGKRRSKQQLPDVRTVRGRISAKLSKQKNKPMKR